jgi:hypothetical protein
MVSKSYRWCRGSKEDQRAEVSSALVGQSASGIDQSTNTVCLDGRAGDGGTPSGGGRGSLLGLDELLLRVGGLGAVVGITEDWAEDGKGSGVVENRAKSDGRWLD